MVAESDLPTTDEPAPVPADWGATITGEPMADVVSAVRDAAAPGDELVHLVADATVVVQLSLEAAGFELLTRRHRLHELDRRGEISPALAAPARDRLVGAPLDEAPDAAHLPEAWRIADAAGWAKTYGAEYVALASILSVPLVTLDLRLRRGAARYVTTMSPDELA